MTTNWYIILFVMIILLICILNYNNNIDSFDNSTGEEIINCFINPSFKTSSFLMPSDLIGQPTIGYLKPRVTLTVFKDLKCGMCKRFTEYIYPVIKEKYIDKNLLAYTTIVIAMLPGSRPAALSALCVYNQNVDLFDKYVNYIYKIQKSENEDWATPEFLVKAASNIPGIDTKQLYNCIITAKYSNQLNKNMDLAMKVMGFRYDTPGVFVNSERIENVSVDTVSNAIDRALKKCPGNIFQQPHVEVIK